MSEFKNEKIFSSYFTLTYSKDSLNQSFKAKMNEIKISKIVFLAIGLALNITSTVLIYQEPFQERYLYLAFANTTILLQIIGIISIILLFISITERNDKSRHEKVEIFDFFNFFYLSSSIGLGINLLRVQESTLNFAESEYYYIALEFLIKALYLIFANHCFPKVFFTNAIIIIFLWVFRVQNQKSVNFLNIGAFTFSYISFTFLTYLYYWNEKKIYLVKKAIQNKKALLSNLFDTLDIGVLVYSSFKRNIKYINSFLSKFEQFQYKEKETILISSPVDAPAKKCNIKNYKRYCSEN